MTSAKFPLFYLGLVTGCRGVLGIDDPPEEVPNHAEAPALPSPSTATAPEDAGGLLPSFCDHTTPAPDFCADFDRGDVSRGWYNEGKTPNPGETGGGTITLDPSLATSGQTSGLFRLPPLVSDKTLAGAFLLWELPRVPRYAVLRANVRIDTANILEGKGRVTLMQLNFGRGIGAIAVYRDAAGTSLEVYDDGGPSVARVALSETVPVGQWRTLSLLLHNYPVLDAGGGEVIVVVAGPAARLPLPPAFRSGTELPKFDVGAMTGRGPMGEFRVNVDDVRVTLTDGP